MEIALISTWEQRCGIATYSAALTSALRELKHNVAVLAETPPGLPTAFEDPRAYPLWMRGTPYESPTGLGRLAKVIIGAKTRPDIVHIQHEFGIFYNTLDLWRFVTELRHAKVRVVMTLHTVLLPPKRTSFFAQIACPVIVHSPAAASVLSRWGAGAHVIPHGVRIVPPTIGPSQAASREELELPADTPCFVSPGFMARTKGHIEMIQAFAELGSRAPHLVIAGECRDDGYFDLLRQAVADYGLEDKVHLHRGFQPEGRLALYYRAATAVVLGAGKTTPFSSSGQLHTASGFGRPVIAKNVPIYREPNALLYDNPKQLAALVEGVSSLRHAEIRQDAVRRSLALAEERQWANVVKRHIEVYGE